MIKFEEVVAADKHFGSVCSGCTKYESLAFYSQDIAETLFYPHLQVNCPLDLLARTAGIIDGISGRQPV